jgi:hypothetical protein
MKIALTASSSRFLLAAVAVLAVAAGCGGGVGTGGTGSFAQGPITGFGSVIVNGVHFEVGSATLVQDADGNVHSADDLQLGMTVDIDAGAISSTSTGSTASASSIRYASEMVGPLVAVDRSAGRLMLLGQTVQADATTVFDDRLAGGLNSLVAGQLVEIYAAVDPASGSYRATRVEPRSSAATFSLRGMVSQLAADSKTFRIGDALFTYGNASALPPTLANGDFVRLQLQPGPAAGLVWAVSSFAGAPAQPADGFEATVKGLISVFRSSGEFSVNGRSVAAVGAIFPDGTSGLGLGVRVEVEGTVQGGVLQATKVSIDSDQRELERGFELRGAIASLDTTAKTFALRGVTIGYGGPVTYKDGATEAKLANGWRVQVKGQLSADGTRVEATEIGPDD